MVQQQHNPFQREDGGANPASPLHFEKCPVSTISLFVKDHHYSHTHPGFADICFRIVRDNQTVGAAIFGHMVGNPKASCICEGYENPKDYRELMRLVLLDDVPKNTESQFIGWCIRYIRKNTSILALISFADPKYGHSGIIYRASNWVYTGLQKQDRPRILIDGKEIHPRRCYNVYGTSSLKILKEMGLNIETAPREPKHRFIYLLRNNLTLKQRLRVQSS